MSAKSIAFDFGTDSVARAYDGVLVPTLFLPWARRLASTSGPWYGRRVLDLATGTGVVAATLSTRVGPDGTVVAADINADMLAMARERCANTPAAVRFVESPAHALPLPDATFDTVVCQQGFQFFPDRHGAAAEVYRVLAPGGRVVVSTWLPVTACEFFGVICAALEDIGEDDIATMMRRPFDFLDARELAEPFQAAGFAEVDVRCECLPYVLNGGIPQAIDVAYATPIGPKLRALPEVRQRLFRRSMADRVHGLSRDGITMGEMVTHVLTAEKPPYRRWYGFNFLNR